MKITKHPLLTSVLLASVLSFGLVSCGGKSDDEIVSDDSTNMGYSHQDAGSSDANADGAQDMPGMPSNDDNAGAAHDQADGDNNDDADQDSGTHESESEDADQKSEDEQSKKTDKMVDSMKDTVDKISKDFADTVDTIKKGADKTAEDLKKSLDSTGDQPDASPQSGDEVDQKLQEMKMKLQNNSSHTGAEMGDDELDL